VGVGVGLGVGVGVGLGVGVAVGVGVGVGLGVGVGVGVGEAATVMLSDDEKKNPVESHARITMACFPAARDRMALRDAFALWAFFTESIYMIIAVTVCSLSRAPAENVTGDVTVAPLAGEQILTVLSTVGVHTADATAAHEREKRRKHAAENPRSDITQGPRMEQSVLPQHPGNGPAFMAMAGAAPPAIEARLFLQVGEQPAQRGCPG
jgi:hypothetical protein